MILYSFILLDVSSKCLNTSSLSCLNAGSPNYLIFCLAIKREEDKVTRSLKDAAKKGHKDVCSILAKEVLNSRKAQNKLHAAKAHMNSVQMQMKNQLGQY